MQLYEMGVLVYRNERELYKCSVELFLILRFITDSTLHPTHYYYHYIIIYSYSYYIIIANNVFNNWHDCYRVGDVKYNLISFSDNIYLFIN